MAKRQTKDEKILEERGKFEHMAKRYDDLTVAHAALDRRLTDVLEERNALQTALAVATSGPEYARVDAQRLRLAAHAYPQDEPQSISWDDLALWFTDKARDAETVARAMRKVAREHGLSEDLDVPGFIEAADEKMAEAREAMATVEAMPENYDDWKDWIKGTEFNPEDVDRMVELLDLLGLSGRTLDLVLQSADMGHTLAKVRP